MNWKVSKPVKRLEVKVGKETVVEEHFGKAKSHIECAWVYVKMSQWLLLIHRKKMAQDEDGEKEDLKIIQSQKNKIKSLDFILRAMEKPLKWFLFREVSERRFHI